MATKTLPWPVTICSRLPRATARRISRTALGVGTTCAAGSGPCVIVMDALVIDLANFAGYEAGADQRYGDSGGAQLGGDRAREGAQRELAHRIRRRAGVEIQPETLPMMTRFPFVFSSSGSAA